MASSSNTSDPVQETESTDYDAEVEEEIDEKGKVIDTMYFDNEEFDPSQFPDQAVDKDGNPIFYEFYDDDGNLIDKDGNIIEEYYEDDDGEEFQAEEGQFDDAEHDEDLDLELSNLRQQELDEVPLEDQLVSELDELIEAYPLEKKNPGHYFKLWWWLFVNPDAVRLHRMKKRKQTLKFVGAWVASTMLWLPSFIYTFYLVVTPKLRPRLLTDSLNFIGVPYLIPTNRLSQQLLIIAAWLMGGLTGTWKGIARRKSIALGFLSSVIGFIVTDVLVGTLTDRLVWRYVATIVFAVLVGITFGLARVVKCDAAVVYTLMVGITQCVVSLLTGIYDSPGGHEFTVALTACGMFTLIGVTILYLIFPKSWSPLRDILNTFVFAISWMVCFYYAAKSAKGDLIWSFFLATSGIFLVLFMFYRGLKAFFRKYEVDHRLKLPKSIKAELPSDEESDDEEVDYDAITSEDEDDRIKRRLRNAAYRIRRRGEMLGLRSRKPKKASNPSRASKTSQSNNSDSDNGEGIQMMEIEDP